MFGITVFLTYRKYAKTKRGRRLMAENLLPVVIKGSVVSDAPKDWPQAVSRICVLSQWFNPC